MQRVLPLLPGILLCVAVSAAAKLLEMGEHALFGNSWLEALVLAILLGTAIRSTLPLPAVTKPGIVFSSKMLLEIAIVLLGASITVESIIHAGPALVGAVVLVVFLSLAAGYAIGRALGLNARLATLVACGNSICGNSAIAAAAPVIDARSDEVASAISFTAVLGVGVVLLLPVAQVVSGLSATQYGVMAGLTVYAVPQVLAAASPMGTLAIQIGTLIKLVRVLMLGPVLMLLGVVNGRAGNARAPFSKLVPWFILGFLLLMAIRSLGLIPEAALPVLRTASTTLTIVAMAALGLTVDIRAVAHAGGRVIAAATLSILFLAVLAVAAISLLGIA
ncbi:putative sulfate exporter family transporter [Acetobacteraceae bacterium H6797]|nr:putative sulfate exporter family transporter [Acetobacteraceae bacterium H6797]